MTHRTTKSYYSILQKYKFRLFQAYQFVAYLQHPLARRIHIVNHTHRFRLFGIDDISPFRFIAVISENISVSEQHALVAAYFLPCADSFGNCRPVGSSPVIKAKHAGCAAMRSTHAFTPFLYSCSPREASSFHPRRSSTMINFIPFFALVQKFRHFFGVFSLFQTIRICDIRIHILPFFRGFRRAYRPNS